jgi:hypothetical protein
MDNDGEGSLGRTVCTVSLLSLKTKCHARWARSYMPSPTKSCTRLPVHWVVKRREVSVIATSQGCPEQITMACAVSHG